GNQLGQEAGVPVENEVDAEFAQFGAVDRGDSHVQLHLADAADGHRVDDGHRPDRLVLGGGDGRHAADEHALRDAEDRLDVLGVGHGAGQHDCVDARGDRLDGGGRDGPTEDRPNGVDVELDDEFDLLL